MQRYVIVGGGIAGTTAAETLRTLDAHAAITIIGDEAHPLYSRVLLPHYLLGKIPRERVFLKSPSWYADHNITLTHDRVVSMDPDAKTVLTEQGTLHPYTKLLITGGGHVRRHAWDTSQTVEHFQTIDDADRILTWMPSLDASQSVGVVGGGFIAMEWLELFRHAGVPVHVFLRGDGYFSPLFPRELSETLRTHLTEGGVTTHSNTTITSWNDSVARTHAGGTFPLQKLAAGLGLDSAFTWAADAGVRINIGVLTNEYLETSVRDVYAAGDCAEFLDVITHRQYRAGNWMTAQMQGRHVAHVLHGTRTPYQLVSSYATHVHDVHIVAVGDASLAHADVLTRSDAQGHTVCCLRDGRLVGAVLYQHVADRAPATKLIQSQTDLTALRHKLADPNTPLQSLL